MKDLIPLEASDAKPADVDTKPARYTVHSMGVVK